MAGADGDRGSPGPSGAKGSPGDAGAKGAKGAGGDTGPRGADGAVGAQGLRGVQGVSGTKGPDGDPGMRGDNGSVGLPGQSFTIDFVVDDIELLTGYPSGWVNATPTIGQFALSGRQLYQFGNNNQWTLHADLGGARGNQGLPGVDGTDGAVGARGPPGVQGIAGNDASTEAVLVVKVDATQLIEDWVLQADRMATATGLPKNVADFTTDANEFARDMEALLAAVADLEARVAMLT